MSYDDIGLKPTAPPKSGTQSKPIKQSKQKFGLLTNVPILWFHLVKILYAIIDSGHLRIPK